MDDQNGICELHRLDNVERLSEVERALEARGVQADIWGDSGVWRPFRGRRQSRLMVRCRDLVYARWVAMAFGLDAWPAEEDVAAGE